MFKRILILPLLLVLAFYSSYSLAKKKPKPDPSDVVIQDRPVPWPWSLEQPFPWTDIQGMWEVDDPSMNSYFVFKVVREKSTGERQLALKQVDATSCKTVASGVGFQLDREVHAQMTVLETGMAYHLSLHAFSQEDSPKPILGRVAIPQVVVMKLSNLDATSEEQVQAIQIGKLSNSVDLKTCNDEKIK